MKTTKTTTLPKKPTTKRDKYFYDMGAKQQAEVFNSLYPHKINNYTDEDFEKQLRWNEWFGKINPRKELLNDYQEPITDYKINWVVITLLVLGLLVLLYAMHGDQQALNAGLIH